MIEKTKDYDIFVFREDNRERIDHSHVKRLVDSIRSKNLLELRPVVVNSKMEVIDGQHRIMAAKELGVPVYYQVEDSLEDSDVIRMNVSKSWGNSDFLNFYCNHGYSEYVKLKEFMHRNQLSLRVAINICLGKTHEERNQFRDGKFEFKQEIIKEEIDVCWDTVNFIKKNNTYSKYTTSTRFWAALLKLIRSPEFDADKWKSNIGRLVDRFSPKASENEYFKMMVKIHNWKNHSPIYNED